MLPVGEPLVAPTLSAAIARWSDQDPDATTREQLVRLRSAAETGDEASLIELTDAFAGPLTFGTAGLRGRLGPGPGRMNRVVVSQAAGGLAGYLLDQGQAGGAVVIGFDARHSSDVFARDTAEILAGAGFSALLLPGPLPTPVLAFAIKHLDCVAGVMVTASHNPREDNGYKVYLGDGVQIVPPVDELIAAKIIEIAAASITDLPRSIDVTVLGPELIQAYAERAAAPFAGQGPRTGFDFVYTPLHGVGAAVVADVLARAGFAAPPVVPVQGEPDPDFPTAPFPNPEEPGALDPAYAFADELGIECVLANDPDADRCAVSIKVDQTWRRLQGDQLGSLLGEDALRRGTTGTFATSIVSATQLKTMAAAHDQPYAATLTGFKWIARAPGLAYGYEEALGYCCDPDAVTDKDGISALLRVAVLATDLAAQGQTLLDRLDEIDRRYGVHATDQLSVRVTDLGLITEAMQRIRSTPPSSLAGETVQVIDLATGSTGLPPTDGLLLEGPTVRVVARPSGTEPKLKCYLQVKVTPAESADLDTARADAHERLTRVRDEMATALGLT